jgi:hypothetical protein
MKLSVLSSLASSEVRRESPADEDVVLDDVGVDEMTSFDSDSAAANTAVAEGDTCPGAVAVPSSTGIDADPWPGVSAGCSAFSSGKFAAGSLVLMVGSTAAAERCELGAGAGASTPASRISFCWSSIFLMSDMVILEYSGSCGKVGRASPIDLA